MAQIGAIAVAAAAAAVVSLITNTIGALLGTANGLLGSINSFFQALVNLWQNVVYPIALINQARLLVTQLIAQFRGLVTAIDNVNVRSATLAESYRARSDHAERVNWRTLRNSIRRTGRPSSRFRRRQIIDPGDRQRVDMSDALAMDTLKTLKASDDVVNQTLQASQIIEDEAAQAAPGSAAYLTGAGMVAAVENQAMMQTDAGGRTAGGGGDPGAHQCDPEAPG